MESAKSPLAVALADERLGKGWRRPRARARSVAVLCALVAAAVLYGLFDSFRAQPAESKPQRQTLASVDLRIGNPAGAAERGEAMARADIQAGLLQVQTFAPITRAAKAQQGVRWVHKAGRETPLNRAFVEAYNRVMRGEIERRLGAEVLEALLRAEPVMPPTR